MRIKKPEPPPLPELKKGSLLVLKVPPYYTKEYLYEVTSAGDKLIRVTLYHSPKVKKQWSLDEFKALYDNKIIRLAEDKDVEALKPSGSQPRDPAQPDG